MKSRRAPALALSLLPLLLAAAPKETVDVLFATKWIASEAISPDAGRVAWVEYRPNADRTPSKNSVIYVQDIPGGQPRQVSAGNGTALADEGQPAWSPDSGSLAFLSDSGERDQLQLYRVAASGGAPRRLTSLKGYLASPKWSPDGKTIALLNIAESKAAAGAVEAAQHESGEIQELVSEARLVLVDAATGATRAVSPPDTYVYEYDWAPDSRRVAAISAKGNGDNNWWGARLQEIDTSSGAVRDLFLPSTQIAVPRWSPDGSTIALIQGIMSDAGSTGGEIWIVPVEGGSPRNLTPGRASSPAWLRWRRGSGRILFGESVDGEAAVSEIDPATGKVAGLWRGVERMDCGSATEMLSVSESDDESASAVVLSSWSRPPELCVGRIGEWTPLTGINRGIHPTWGRGENIHWTSDGHEVQGWLLYPRDFDRSRHYPLIVNVHGGPAAQATQIWPAPNSLPSILSAEGYFVLTANPRGSFGKGEAFTAANIRDFGGGDLRDIMAGVDQVLGTLPVDGSRLGIAGWSYGGYMTMWTVTQTHRFRAAVAGAGIANLQSYYGQNQIDGWMIPYFGASVYEDPAAYARCSPITFIKNARTPMLIVVGDSDKECPAPQSFEYWHALKTLGVETKLVVYENEGHHFRNPAHMADLIDRSLDWFDSHLR